MIKVGAYVLQAFAAYTEKGPESLPARGLSIDPSRYRLIELAYLEMASHLQICK